MGFFDRVFGKAPPTPVAPPAAPPAPKPVIQVGTYTAPISVNPSEVENIKFAQYRIGAIIRDRQQRANEGRDRNPDHDIMTGEARMYGGVLMRFGVWTQKEWDAMERDLGVK